MSDDRAFVYPSCNAAPGMSCEETNCTGREGHCCCFGDGDGGCCRCGQQEKYEDE